MDAYLRSKQIPISNVQVNNDLLGICVEDDYTWESAKRNIYSIKLIEPKLDGTLFLQRTPHSLFYTITGTCNVRIEEPYSLKPLFGLLLFKSIYDSRWEQSSIRSLEGATPLKPFTIKETLKANTKVRPLYNRMRM